MVDIFKIIFLSLGIGLAVLSLTFAGMAIGFCKKNIAKAKGYLTLTEHKRNVYGRMVYYPHYVTATYNYRVNGKQYQISFSHGGNSSQTPSNMTRTVDIYYQKTCPRFAYIDVWPVYPALYAFVSVSVGVISAMFIICGIFM